MEHRLQEKQRAELLKLAAMLDERQTQNALSFVQAMNGCEELPKQDCNS